MSILSLQAIIQKYGANFGIDPKAALKTPAKDAGGKTANASGANASAQTSPTDAATKKIPLADSVNLSPAAKDFLASHTGPLGQFEMPNVMDDFFNALDGTDQSGGSGTGNSLLDYLSNSNSANPADGSSGANPFDFQNPFGISNSPSQSLDSFL